MSRFTVIAVAPAALLALAAPAPAQQGDWSHARQIEVVLANFEYRPADLRLKAGEPVILELRNMSDNGHDFTARDLFRNAAVRSGDLKYLDKGSVEVPAGARRRIGLIPTAGRYKVKCTHTFHHMLGMGGEIVVE